MSLIHPFSAKRSIRQRCVLFIGAFAYALLFSLGSQIEQYGYTRFYRSILRFSFSFPAALFILLILFHGMDCISVLPKKQNGTSDSPVCTVRSTVICFVVLFLCYVPMFLIQYPGSFTYDIMPQSIQAASGEYNTFHPLLHTLFLKACLSCTNLLDSFEHAAALCSIIQMAVVSWCFSMICTSICRCFSRGASVAALLFFGLYPSHMAFASTFTKDVMFSSFFALFMALSFEDIAHGRLTRPRRIVCVFSGVLACLLRNNMIYAMAVWLVLLLLGRRPMRRLLLCALAVFILSRCANFALETATHAKPGPTREMLSIPAQQFARVRLYAADQLTQQECEQMDSYFNQVNYERYDPTLADAIKDRISEQAVSANPAGAAKFWISLGKKHPALYLDAFLSTALPALYPCSEYSVSAPYIEIGECRIGLTQPFGLAQIQQPGRFAGIRSLLNDQVFSTGADHHPIARWLFNSGFIFWLLLSQLLYALYAGNDKCAAVMCLALLLWGTFLLGPVIQGRYLYPFVCILPLFLLYSHTGTNKS